MVLIYFTLVHHLSKYYSLKSNTYLMARKLLRFFLYFNTLLNIMKTLSKKEILAELKRIGISTQVELDLYFREYEKYYCRQLPYTNSVQKVTLTVAKSFKKSDIIKPLQSPIV